MSGELIARCRAALAENDETAANWMGCGHREERLALNRALTVVLDGIEATLDAHQPMRLSEVERQIDAQPGCTDHTRGHEKRVWPCPDHHRATASLAAIAQALGVS